MRSTLHCIAWFTGLAILGAGFGCGVIVEGSAKDDTGEVGDDDACIVGALECPCTAGGGCDPGLECVDMICTAASSDGSETDDGACTSEGCPCVDEAEACDPGLVCTDGVCTASDCGNGGLDANEQCDDGNALDGDGCDNDCTFTKIVGLALGDAHSCAHIEGGRVRCWGQGAFGQLGRAAVDDIGDDETPASVGDLPLPGPIVELDSGADHVCARFEDGAVRCWGRGVSGQLGYANVANIGDDETLEDLAPVDLFETVAGLGLGSAHGCARTRGGKLRCWGANAFGQLGLSHVSPIGDDETPSAAEIVFLGADASFVAGGGAHTCALSGADQLRCWGQASRGQLGRGSVETIGDTEPPADEGVLAVVPGSLPAGTGISQLALGREHTCVLLTTGDVLCWGRNDLGQLGQGNALDWGGQVGQVPAALEPIDLGAAATAITAGGDHSCAVLTTGDVRCWGANASGQLGLASVAPVGNVDAPAQAPVVSLGGAVISLAAGGEHTCAVLDGHVVRCWGRNDDGRLGLAHTDTIGDDESPSEIAAIDLL